jgi:hypothetical protein
VFFGGCLDSRQKDKTEQRAEYRWRIHAYPSPAGMVTATHLRELEIGGVNSKEGLSLGVEGSDADLGVDVEETLLSARRPDSALNGEGVSAEVVVVEEALEGKGGGGLVMGAKVSVGCNRAGNGYS